MKIAQVMPVVALLVSPFLPWKSQGQTEPAPVTVVRAEIHNGHWYGKPNMHVFEVEFRNISSKEIEAVEFEVTFVNVMEEKTAARRYIASKKSVKPGENHTANWRNVVNQHAKSVEAKPVKVLFKDGTKWATAASSTSEPYRD